MSVVRVVPIFAEGPDDLSASQELARELLGSSVSITVHDQASGAALLRELVAQHPGCADLDAAAELLSDSDRGTLLVLAQAQVQGPKMGGACS